MAMSDDLVIYEEDDDHVHEGEVEESDEIEVVEHDEDLDAEIDAAKDELARLSQEAAEIIESTNSNNELVLRDKTPLAAKKNMAVLRARVLKKQNEITERKRELQELMQRRMDFELRRANEIMAPLQKMVDYIQETIWTVNLYLGRDEEIVMLREGEPAPANTPLHLRQMVLAMDQESAIHAEEGGIDARNVAAFDEWLLADPAHLDQVLPEQKGVVVLRPRFDAKNTGDPWKDSQLAEMNERSYFLIRNGDSLYRTLTDFKVGDKLIPTEEEFASFFFYELRDYKTGMVSRVPLEPGTQQWIEAEEKADARQRHYMRVGLILQGLIDRTTVFHPLPDQGLNMLGMDDYSAGRIVWISDAENTLDTGREKFRDWQRRLNSELRPGMRIIGSFDYSMGFRESYSSNDGNDRISPRYASAPESEVLHQIERKNGEREFVILYERTDTVYRGWSEQSGPAKRRASCRIYADDRFILPYDLITVEEMEDYLKARLERDDYVEMFPLLKAAIRTKKAEAEEEAPFRTMLVGVLARENGVSVEDAEEQIDDLINWWKLTNKNHRPLIGDEESQALAVRRIVTEHARRIKASTPDPKVVAKLRGLHTNALMIARRRNGRYVVVTPQNDQDIFVTRHDYTPTGKPTKDGVEEWKLLSQRWLAPLVIAHKTERFDNWNLNLSLADYLTDPEMEDLAAQLVEEHKAENGDNLIAVVMRRFVKGDAKNKKRFEIYAFNPNRETFYSNNGLDCYVRPWTRTQGMKAVLAGDHNYGHSGSGYSSQAEPWDDFEDSYRKVTYDRFYFNEQRASEWRKWKQEREAIHDARRSRENRVSNARRSVEQAWVKRATEKAYEEFLEEYLDPELWEGHHKLRPIHYPYNHREDKSWGEADEFLSLLGFLVAKDMKFDGLTVAEARNLALEQGWVAKVGEFAGTKKLTKIPKDILDLKIKDEPGKDEDDWEDEIEEGVLGFEDQS